MIRFLRQRRRLITALLATGCFLMFGYALYQQYHQLLVPCPLCIFQRIGVASLGVALLVAAVIPQGWRIIGNVSAVLVALVGLATMGISARHLYIQSQPEGSVPACGAALDYMLEVFPLTEVLRKVLTGSGECAKVDWSLLGISMPGWVLISVLLLTSAGLLVNWRTRKTGWSRS